MDNSIHVLGALSLLNALSVDGNGSIQYAQMNDEWAMRQCNMGDEGDE